MTLTCSICSTAFEWKPRGGRQPLTCGSDPCRKTQHARSVVEYRWRQRGGSTTQKRECIRCGKPFEFVRVQGMRGAPSGFCSDECEQERVRERARAGQKAFRNRKTAEERAVIRRTAHLARFGLTDKRFDAMAEAQDNVCAICGQQETKHHNPRLKIDHDRSCCPGDGSCGKCVRGLLCSNCNRGLGLFGDNTEILRSAIEYLTRAAIRAG